MSDALFAQGTKFFLSVSNAWVEAPELRAINVPEAQSTFIETTHLNSENNDDEFIKGLNRKGNCTGEVAYLPQHAVILKLYELRNALGLAGKTAMLVEFPDAAETVHYFEAYVESVGPPAARVGGDLALPFSCKPTGKLRQGTGGSGAISADPTTWV